MKKLISKTGMALVFIIAMPSLTIAAEMDHSRMDHSKMDHSKKGKMDHGMNGPKVAQPKAVKKGKLNRLPAMPASGRSREAGYDGRYAMEPTSNRSRLSEQCAQASRGIVMLDNATWKRCGGKPEGAAMGPERKGAGGKMDHSTMDHSRMKR